MHENLSIFEFDADFWCISGESQFFSYFINSSFLKYYALHYRIC